MSAPAAKARSEPVMTMQRTCVPRSQSSRTPISSFNSSLLSAFSALGRLSVIRPTPSSTATRMFWYSMGCSVLFVECLSPRPLQPRVRLFALKPTLLAGARGFGGPAFFGDHQRVAHELDQPRADVGAVALLG